MNLKAALFVGSVTLFAPPALAQSDDAAARALFDEGRKLMDQGKFQEACPKFEEGQRLSPGIGMKFNLAECYERLGKLASAWGAFLDVASMAKNAGQLDREKVARRRASALEPELLRVEIDVPAASRLQGLEVRRDDAVVGVGQWGTAIPADPGEHTVTATAPGRRPFAINVTVKGAAGAVTKISVPLLAIDPSSKQKPTEVVSEGRGNTQRALGVIAGSVGLVGLGVGSGLGIIALNKQAQSLDYCYPGNVCEPKGIALRGDAITFGDASTIAFIAGGATTLLGVILFLSAPSGSAAVKVQGTGARLELTF